MDEFVSTFTNRLDAKGRVSIPASFRAVLVRDGFEGLYCCPTLDRQAVDAGGTATLEMTITAMRNEFIKPNGKSVVIDSACHPDQFGCAQDIREWEYDPDTDLVSFFTCRAVAAGEELLFDYGPLYWESRPELLGRLAAALQILHLGGQRRVALREPPILEGARLDLRA